MTANHDLPRRQKLLLALGVTAVLASLALPAAIYAFGETVEQIGAAYDQ